MSTGMFLKMFKDAMARLFGTAANTICQGNDTRLPDAAPTGAGSLVKSTGGAPPYTWSELAAGSKGCFAGLALDAAPGAITGFVNPIATFNQEDEPTTDQIPAGFVAIWTDSGDSKCYVCYNHGGTVKTTELT